MLHLEDMRSLHASRRLPGRIGLPFLLLACSASAELRALRVSVPREVVYAYEPAIAQDRGALLPALCYDDLSGEVKGIVVPLDERGRPGTAHVVGHHPWSQLYGAVPVNGGWLAAGTAGPAPNQSLRPWLVRLDDEGAPVREYTMDPGGDFVDGGFLEPASDGGAFLWATACPISSTCRPWIAKLDADGALLWERSYDTAVIQLRDLVATADGGAILLSAVTEGGVESASILDVSGDGSAVRERLLLPAGWQGTPRVLSQARNGDLLVFGDEGSPPSGPHSSSFWFARLRDDDIVALDRTGNAGNAWDAIERPDESILVVGGRNDGNFRWRGRAATVAAGGGFGSLVSLGGEHQVAFAALLWHDGAAWGAGIADDRTGTVEGLLAPLDESRVRSRWSCLERADLPLLHSTPDMTLIARPAPGTIPTTSTITDLPPHSSSRPVEVRDACGPPGGTPPAWGRGGRRGGRGPGP